MKYLKTYEEKSKGNNIVYTFKTKAKSGKNEYDVHLLKGNSEYDNTNGYSYNGLILSIDNTPGSWYVSTFLHYNPNNKHDTITIDGGSNWIVENGLEIEKELKYWIENIYPIYKNVNKYNL